MAINEALEPAKDKQAILRGLQVHAQEAKSSAYAPAIENAREDYKNPSRCALIVQCLLDEVWPMLELGPVPQVKASVVHHGSKTNIRWTVDSPYFRDTNFFDHLGRILGKEAGFHNASPLAAAGEANRMIVTASQLRCDLYLPKPVSRIVGDKLSESARTLRTQQNVDLFKSTVEFPNIRLLLNNGTLSIKDIIRIRKKAQRFRTWVQTEAERDRDSLIAYHHEVAEESDLIKYGRSSLSLFGWLLGIGAAYVVGQKNFGFAGALATAVSGATPPFLASVAAKYGADWKPVIFGNWLKCSVEKAAHRKRR